MKPGKIGRNDPCPCGSAKKYKHCCLRRSELSTIGSSHRPETQLNFDVQNTTFPGEESWLTLVPVFPPGDPRNTDEPKGLPGDYSVTFVLNRPSRPELPEERVDFSERLRGDSYIAITQPAIVPNVMPNATGIRVRAQTPDGSFLFDGIANQTGYLGKLKSQPFAAQTFDDAFSKAYHAIAPSLSYWSAYLDVPVLIVQMDAEERRTGARRIRLVTPPLKVAFAIPGEPALASEFRHYASLYREALNSNSPVYRFLCLFKIIEGIRVRRKRLAEDVKKNGKEPQRLDFERVPENQIEDWLNALYHVREWPELMIEQVLPTAVRGKKFGNIIDSILNPLRNEVAHGILDTGELGMSADDLLKVQKVNLWLPLTRTIVRRMLKNSFREQFLTHLSEPTVEAVSTEGQTEDQLNRAGGKWKVRTP